MRKTNHRILGFLLIALAVIHLTEGNLLISIISQAKINNYAIHLEDDLLSCDVAGSSDNNVLVKIYNDKNDQNLYYILEYGKNSLLSHYSLNDVTKYDNPSFPIYSVASTAIFDYPYSIDIQCQTITIYEKKISSNLIRSMFILGIGFLCVIRPKNKGDKYEENT